MRRGSRPFLAVLLAGSVVGACRREVAEPVEQHSPRTHITQPNPVEPRNIPILCMHDIGPNARNEYSVKTADLEKYVKWLHDQGFSTVTLRQVAAYLAGQTVLPPKPVVLTFDDNWKSAVTIAKPLLERYGYVGVAFVISASVGSNPRRLTWDDCKLLAAAGWEIGSHGRTHINLTAVPKGLTLGDARARAIEEIRQSKAEIEDETGLQVNSFALPFGNYDTFILQSLKDAGYSAAVTIDRSTADERSDPWRLPRRMVMNRTAFSTFKRFCESKALHLEKLTPLPGARVTDAYVKITATVADSDVLNAPTGELMGKRLEVMYDPTTRKLTAQAKLHRGANSIALTVPGREVSWLLIRDS